jgi:hypothetical protein
MLDVLLLALGGSTWVWEGSRYSDLTGPYLDFATAVEPRPPKYSWTRGDVFEVAA